MRRGKLIVIEGGEGCGKTLQTGLLEKYLNSRRKDIIQANDELNPRLKIIKTHEPGGTKIGEMLRLHILSPEIQKIPLTETFLFEAARAQLIHDVIKPAIERGHVVLTDRGHYATTAYQGYGEGLDIHFITEIKNRAVSWVQADLSMIIDVPAYKGMKNVDRRIEEKNQNLEEGITLKAKA